MATESKPTAVKLKSSAQQHVSASKPKFDSSALKKKIDSTSSRNPPDSKMKSVTTVTKSPNDSKMKSVTTVTKSTTDSKVKSATTTVTKSEVKSKATASSSKTITKKTTTTKVRERKVYNLPGQKHDPPEQKEPLRVFYESLSKQIPTSEMAEFWLMEHGLLSPDKAKKAFEKKQRKQKGLWTGGTPVKSSKPSTSTKTKTETLVRKQLPQGSKNGDIKAKKKIVSESDDDDDDFILSHKRRKW